MKLKLKLGISDDPWYQETRSFLTEIVNYLDERITNSCYYFSLKDLDWFEFERK